MTRPYLGNPKYTIEVLQKYNFAFQKRFGQNFLIDTHVLEKIIDASQITKDDFVLEIGPGIGTMTQYLAEAAREVVAVEIDKTLIPILENDTLKDWDNVTVINEDILKVDIAALAQEKNGGKPIKVVANLPYYITTPIIMGLFENHVPISSITIMVQKEVADRMQVGPGTKDYGALSLAVQYYAKPQIIANVPPNCFMPRPKVGSAVIQLVRYEEPPVQVENEKLMFRLIRASFNQRRKTLINGLKNSQELDFSKEEIEKAMAETGIPANVRGEALTLKEVADRMQVGPGTKDYGALSLAVQYYAKPQIIANVPPNCFMPRPKVGSAVIQLVRYEEPPVQVENEKLMFRLIRASFNQRRKTLINGLKNSQELDFSKEEIEKAMAETGIPANVRGEALTLKEFADLANAFHKLR